MVTLREFCAELGASRRRLAETAVNHLESMLGRPATLADVNPETVGRLLECLKAGGRRPESVRRVRTSLNHVAQTAVASGELAGPIRLPSVSCETRIPYSGVELSRLFAAARTMEGRIAGLPADAWWPALLCTIIDARLHATEAIELPVEAFDPSRGTLDTGPIVADLHPLTLEFLGAIGGHGCDRLLPFDRCRDMLYHRMKIVLWRAGVAHVSRNSFDRLRFTGRRRRDVLDEVDLATSFRPRRGKPRIPRARDKQRRRPKMNWPTPAAVYRLDIDSPRTLRRFFDECYLPHRLADAAETSAQKHRIAIDRLSWFLGCDVTLDMLSEDLLDGWLAWLKRSGKLTNPSINGYRRAILAQWRYAWRKRKLPELPRDVIEFKESKRLPESWSTDEVGRILRAAGELAGTVGRVPAGRWWQALLLTLYDTGLRIEAVLGLEVTQFDRDSRDLVVPAELQKQRAEQSFRLHPDTVAAIAETDPEGRSLLFGGVYCVVTLQRRLREILKAAGLPHGRRDLFHKMRRTSGTAVAQAMDELAAKAHLGHSSLQVTSRYLDPRKITRKKAAADVIERPELA